MIEYTLVRSKRRTIAIHILPDVRVEVRAPLRCSKMAIDAFVASKEPWIQKKLAVVRERQAQRQSLTIKPGDTFPFQGREYYVCASPNGKLFFDGTAFFLPAGLFSENMDRPGFKAAMTSLYKKLTLPLVQERTAYFAELLGVRPAAVKVSAAAKRWGSCSGKNSLNFSWMLAAADPRAVDYVVVHELYHIREHNHSPAFWRLVESQLPDYKMRQTLLREAEKRLSVWSALDDR